MSLSYGDTLKFEATHEEKETKKFVLKRSKSASSKGYKLHGYNPEKNKLELLEDFGISGTRPSLSVIREKAVSKIQFYCRRDDGWTIRSMSSTKTTY